MTQPTEKRYTVTRSYPENKFMEYQLELWKEEAVKNGTQSRFTYAKALRSLKKYPLHLRSGLEAKILDGFGDGICKRLDQALEQCRAEHGPDITLDLVKQLRKEKGKRKSTEISGPILKRAASTTVDRADKDVVAPVKRANTNALALSISGNESQTEPKQNTVVNKTDKNGIIPVKRSVPQTKPNETVASEPCFPGTCAANSLRLVPESYEILLIVDWAEVGGKILVENLQKLGVAFQKRRLAAGDFLWIAQSKENSEVELVLDYIVERKRLDDLAHSICGKDNRYRDQKVRLRECGLKHRIFLVEGENSHSRHLALPLQTLKQAITNTQVHEDFYVKLTDDAVDSALYLAAFTQHLKRIYRPKTLISKEAHVLNQEDVGTVEYAQTLGQFQQNSVKSRPLCVRELFARQLMCVRGMSAEKANAVVARYPSLKVLMEAYDNCPQTMDTSEMLADLTFGEKNKRLGSQLSAALANLSS